MFLASFPVSSSGIWNETRHLSVYTKEPYHSIHFSCCRCPCVSDRNCCRHVAEILTKRTPHFYLPHPQRLQEGVAACELLLCEQVAWVVVISSSSLPSLAIYSMIQKRRKRTRQPMQRLPPAPSYPTLILLLCEHSD